jgi:hypothetical protein
MRNLLITCRVTRIREYIYLQVFHINTTSQATYTGTYIHLPSGIRAHDPSVQALEVIFHVRQLGTEIC